MKWSKVPGWEQDHHAEAWPALIKGCERVATQDAVWQGICARANAIDSPTNTLARAFFEDEFLPHRVRGARGKRRGLITGYYEPLLHGNMLPTERFRYPIYQRPEDLLTIELGEVFSALQGQRVRGRLVGRKVVPYYDRAAIDSDANPLRGNELLWVDNAQELFFLHIQGSGRVRLTDGRVVGVGYADQNGHPYTSIGRVLMEQGELERDAINLFTIREWLRTNPHRAEALLHTNASYVFFTLRDTPQAGPIGSLQVPLTPERSLAVDPATIPLGLPVWLDTRLPDDANTPYRRLVFAQDTGGAIKGHLRADLFWGQGPRAERMAGTMKQEGRLFVLVPKTQ